MLEAPYRDSFALLRSSDAGRRILQMAAAELGDWPADWQRLAQAREAWTLFARHSCFKKSGPRQMEDNDAGPNRRH